MSNDVNFDDYKFSRSGAVIELNNKFFGTKIGFGAKFDILLYKVIVQCSFVYRDTCSKIAHYVSINQRKEAKND